MSRTRLPITTDDEQTCCRSCVHGQFVDQLEISHRQHHDRSRLLDGEDLGWSGITSDLINRKWSPLWTGHARRTRRHARDRNADDVGTIRQELVERVDRYMALDRIPADDHHVAPIELFRNSELFP